MQQAPGARFAVVDEDPYGPTITFWDDQEEAFKVWTERFSHYGVSPHLLERHTDDIQVPPVDYYGDLLDDELATRVEDYRRNE